jgi:MSHA biogenesis protein MshJ
MKGRVARLAERVDAMSVRERFLIFLCVLTALGALTWVLFVLPLGQLQKQRAAQLDQQSADMERRVGNMQVGILEGRRTRAAQLGADIARVQGEIDSVEREIAALSAGAGEAAALPGMLKRVLRNTDKVALVRATAASDEGAAPPPGVAGLSGRGLDITLSGGYLDLMEYLAALEAALPQAQWSALRLTAETAPPQVAVRIAMPRGQR